MPANTPLISLLLLGAAVILAGCDAAQGAPAPTPYASHGERLALRHCASCHALRADAQSPLKDAPTFPTLRARYSTQDMASILQKRMTELHRRMPLVAMGPDEFNAFLAYWDTVSPISAPDTKEKARPRDKTEAGRIIVARDCGGCHATGVSGASGFPAAPPFRLLGARYEIEGLAEALAEGISVGHPAMPERAYPAEEVAAIITYLQSVQPVGGRAENRSQGGRSR